MPMLRLAFRGGVDVERSPSLNRDGWAVSNLIRWRSGVPEAVLGWMQTVASAIAGVARAMHYWADLAGQGHIAVGSNTNLYVTNFVANANVLVDITPSVGFIPGPPSSGAGVPFSLLIWSLDNFGQDLLANPSGQGIFKWTPPFLPPLATLIATAPAANNGLIVLDQLQIVLAWGCTPLGGGAGDPMLLRWCDQSDDTDWTPSTTNQAGSYRLPHGSRIIGGLQIPGMALIWTDIGLWSVQYIGFPLVFSIQPIGANCGLIAQKALAVQGQVVYWMSDHGFFRLTGGGPDQMPCPVWDVVYKNLNAANQDKCLVGTNYHYSEVWFFYPSIGGGSGEIDSYVKVNIQEGEWDYGPATPGVPNAMARTAWTDQNNPGHPIGVDLGGLMQQVDIGFTQNGGAAIPSSIRSGYMDIADGGQLMTVDKFLPDFLWDGPNPSLNLTLYFRKWPGDQPTVMGPFTITPTTEYVTLRSARQVTIGGVTVTAYPAIRAREVAVEVDGQAGWWRWGNPRLRRAPAGRV